MRKMTLYAQHTNKLFWSRYLYKFTVRLPQISFLRYGKNKVFESLFKCETYEQWQSVQLKDVYRYRYMLNPDAAGKERLELWNKRFQLFKFVNFINKHKINGVDLRVRYESDTASVCTNNKDLFDEGVALLTGDVIELFWPKSDKHSEFLVNNPHYEIVEKYPYNKFMYKVELKGYQRIDRAIIHNIDQWFKNYSSLQITKDALEQLKEGFMANGKFIYSTNEKDMLLLQMLLGNLIKRIVTYKLESEIENAN